MVFPPISLCPDFLQDWIFSEGIAVSLIVLQGLPSIGYPYLFPLFSRIQLLHIVFPPIDRARFPGCSLQAIMVN